MSTTSETPLPRTTLNLDGVWEVEESNERDVPPASFGHSARVPGLLSSASPAFAAVGEFATAEAQIFRRMLGWMTGGAVSLEIDEGALEPRVSGVSFQDRDYFWYRRTFTTPIAREHASLSVLKAQFGSAIWLNGTLLGESDASFTSATYDASSAVRWDGDNELVIRVGAHPGVLPPGNAVNVDYEKEAWYPGIWDTVELHVFDGPSLDSVQVAPRISPRQILIETVVTNAEEEARSIILEQTVTDLDGHPIADSVSEPVTIAPGESLVHSSSIALPDAELWSPSSPNLYKLVTSTGGDSVVTRFGIRELRFDTSTKRAYLNDEMIFLRGSGIALHRFFEDPLCGNLPWDDDWVRKLLGDRAQRMNFNMLKLTISPVPRKWFDIADELGLILNYEFPMWTLSPAITGGFDKYYDHDVVKKEMGDWVRDSRNHPSLAWWATSLESVAPWMADEVLPEVRKLDLSGRAWSDSFNPPSEPDDPKEDHPYEFAANQNPDTPHFDMVQLESRGAFSGIHIPGDAGSGHASIIGEYGWLWLNRLGDPTLLTQNMYPSLPYPTATRTERIETACYLLAGLTEYWRSFRNQSAIIFYGYLASSKPLGRTYTSDYFADVEQLLFHEPFTDYVGEAFKPVGVYINFWQRQLQAGSAQSLHVMICNDSAEDLEGTLNLTFETADGEVELGSKPIRLKALGQATVRLTVTLPTQIGPGTLRASAVTTDGSSTLSRRWLELTADVVEIEHVEEAATGQFQ
jgi:beta-galactosidase